MHPLTKIFIVLQALLSVLVAALVIPLAVNDDTWQDRYQGAQAQIQSLESEAEAAYAAAAQELTEAQAEITRLQNELARERSRAEGYRTQIVDLRTQRDNALQDSAAVKAELGTLSATVETQSNIIETQSGEITDRREQSLKDRQRSIELEDQLRDVSSQLEVALDAQRILQERIQQLREEMDDIRTGGTQTADTGAEMDESALPSPPIVGRVLKTSAADDGSQYVEIDLGSRDGVSENMKFILSRNGRFLANLIITNVDINRSSGRLELVQGDVSVNDKVTGTGGVRF
ncbi:MAG: hypothetical protein ACF8PN_11385 [Phycisphaerales bacterium]